jgi:hypothetical protein
MPREVTDAEGVRWTCVQAYAGLAQSADESGNKDAARVDGAKDRFRVVCTPSGGAQTAELELPGDWEEGMDDEALLKEIGGARGG